MKSKLSATIGILAVAALILSSDCQSAQTRIPKALEQANTIKLPEFRLNKVTPRAAAELLSKAAKRHDPKSRGCNVLAHESAANVRAHITLELRDVTVTTAAERICEQAGLSLLPADYALVFFAPDEPRSWAGRTCLPDDASLAELNRLANQPESDRADRARVIFKLFAHHVRPGCSAAELAQVLTDVEWLEKINLTSVIFWMGSPPPLDNSTREDSVFELTLFPLEKFKIDSDWRIFMKLSGHGRSEQNAMQFLKGDPEGAQEAQLIEFALCFPYPSASATSRRIEKFGQHGLRVLD